MKKTQPGEPESRKPSLHQGGNAAPIKPLSSYAGDGCQFRNRLMLEKLDG